MNIDIGKYKKTKKQKIDLQMDFFDFDLKKFKLENG